MTAEGVKLGVLVSGRGSNLQSIIDAVAAGCVSARIAVVISNVPDAYALIRAAQHNIPTAIVDHRSCGDRQAFEEQLHNVLQHYEVELIALAGFMRILSPAFVDRYPFKILNIHPALLPAFPGLHVQRKALRYGVKFSGCTVHFVDAGTDSGPIIAQAVVPVLDDDTADTLAARILKEEHRIYPLALERVIQGAWKLDGRRVLSS